MSVLCESGCGLCGSESAPTTSFTTEELDSVLPLLTSLTSGSSSYWTDSNSVKSVFCLQCEPLLKEVKRLQVLGNTATSQLDVFVTKVKEKFAERPLVVKWELIINGEGYF